MKVTIPRSFTKLMISPFLSQIITQDNKPKDKEIIFDMTQVQFMTPGGVAALFNIGMWLQQVQGVNATFVVASKEEGSFKNLKAMEYLEDCGFFKQFFDSRIVYKEPMLPPTTLEVRTVKVKDSYEWTIKTLKEWLRRCTGRIDEFSNIQVAIEEIFNNICDHSSEQIGCVFAQFYPAKDIIVIAISDFGKGIPNVMRELYPDLTDEKLLIKALEEGVSTKSSPKNRGAGLTNIMRSLTNEGIGSVHIFSNYAKLSVSNKEVTQELNTNTYYPGTFFEIEIDISNEALYESEEEDDFEW
jgi:anti-sigma regulatory factor (Ser/Thr protein kinase)